MNIRIIAIGKNRGYLGEETVQEYTSRLGHYADIEWKYINGSEKSEESEAILKAIPEGSFVVLLDEKGKQMSSIGLADFIQKRLNGSTKHLVYIIGGAHGVSDEVRVRADYVWALSELTFPHELVRSVLSEGLYRAFTIINGQKYHHV